MKRKLLVIGALTLALAGCSASPATEPTPTPTVEPISAETTCTQYSNTTGTLLYNAWNQFNLGITTDAERESAIADAHAKLQLVEVEPGSELETDLRALREFAVNDLPRDFGVGTDWGTAEAALAATCTESGTELFVNAWNGG